MRAVILLMSPSSALTKMKGTGSFIKVLSSCWMRKTPAVEPLGPRLEGPAPMTEGFDKLLAITQQEGEEEEEEDGVVLVDV